MRKHNNQNKKVKGPKPKTYTSEKKQEIKLIRSYPRQIAWDVWLPGTPTKGTTIVTTGVIAFTQSVSRNQVTAFTTRFQSTFVEYRIVQARFRIRLFSSTNPGVLQIFIDEKNTPNPTLAEANERSVMVLSASATDRAPELMWTCADPLDLQYQVISAVTQPATFKIYTDNANFGSSIVATDYFEVEPEFRFQFRGLLGV
jgi:hypothetical protein